MDTIQDSDKVKLVEYSCDNENDTSGLQNENPDEGFIGETDDVNEASNVQGGGKEITAGPWTLTIPQVRKEKPKEEKTIHCTLCSESFFL